jgi:CheY-like chemotaxis protein
MLKRNNMKNLKQFIKDLFSFNSNETIATKLDDTFEMNSDSISDDICLLNNDSEFESRKKMFESEEFYREKDKQYLILIVDDDAIASFFIKNDFEELNNLKLKVLDIMSNKEDILKDSYKDLLLEIKNDTSLYEFFIKSFDLNKYQIKTVSNQFCGFKIKELLNSDNSFKPDIAVLDIILGDGIRTENQYQLIDGIDLLKLLKLKNKDVKYKFITGCALSTASKEVDKLKKLNVDLEKDILLKNGERIARRISLLKLLQELENGL